MSMFLQDTTARRYCVITVWHEPTKEWLGYQKLYGTDYAALEWNLKQGGRVRYHGIEVVLRDGKVVPKNPNDTVLIGAFLAGGK